MGGGDCVVDIWRFVMSFFLPAWVGCVVIVIAIWSKMQMAYGEAFKERCSKHMVADVT